MKIKITIETNSEETGKKVDQFFKENYQKLADYAIFHQRAVKANIDIYKLLMDVHVKTFCLNQKKLAKLVFSKDSHDLHMHIVRQIRDTIRPDYAN